MRRPSTVSFRQEGPFHERRARPRQRPGKRPGERCGRPPAGREPHRDHAGGAPAASDDGSDDVSDAPTEVFAATPAASHLPTADEPPPHRSAEPSRNRSRFPSRWLPRTRPAAARWRSTPPSRGGVAAVAVVAYAVDFAVSSDRVPRGVTVAGVEIGGQNDQDARGHAAGRTRTPCGPTGAGACRDHRQLDRSGAGRGGHRLGRDRRARRRTADQPVHPAGVVVHQPGDRCGLHGGRRRVDRRDRRRAAAVRSGAPRGQRRVRGRHRGAGRAAARTEPAGGAAKDTFVAQWADGTTVDLPVDTVDVAVTQAGVDAAVRDSRHPPCRRTSR